MQTLKQYKIKHYDSFKDYKDKTGIDKKQIEMLLLNESIKDITLGDHIFGNFMAYNLNENNLLKCIERITHSYDFLKYFHGKDFNETDLLNKFFEKYTIFTIFNNVYLIEK